MAELSKHKKSVFGEEMKLLICFRGVDKCGQDLAVFLVAELDNRAREVK